MLDNHIYWGNELDIDTRRVALAPVVDMNDRALRHVATSLAACPTAFPREAGFDITVASEVMAILCLSATIWTTLKNVWADIIVAYRRDRSPVYAATSKLTAR